MAGSRNGIINLDSASRSSIGQSQIVKCSHVWSIHHFTFYNHKQKSGEICSNTFLDSANTQNKNTVQLQWYMNLVYEPRFEYHMRVRTEVFKVCLNLLNPIKITGSAYCQFSILNLRNEIAFTFPTNAILHSERSCSFKFDASKLFKKRDELLPDDTLNIYCEVWRDLYKEQGMNDIDGSSCRLSDDIKLLFYNENLSDVILSAASGIEFRAHKTVLAARSSVFQAMFDHEMKENTHNRVDIIDMDPAVLKELLWFIYTDELPTLNIMASDLLVAADKYAIHKLKTMCENELCSNLCNENVLRLLMLAGMHNAAQLKAQAMHFIKMNAIEVMKTPEWKDVFQLPHLMGELLRP